MASRKIFWALPLSLSIAFAAACAEEDEPTGQGGGNVVTPGGTPGGAGGTGAAQPGGAGGTTPGGAAGAGGTTPGGAAGAGGTTPGGVAGAGGTTSGAAAGAGGMTSGAAAGTTAGTGGPGATGGTGGGPGGGVALVKCDTGGDGRNTKACGSFVSSLGVEFQLGPYGGQMDPPNVGKGFETAGEGGADFICGIFVASFGEDPAASERLLNVEDLDMTLYTVYRPANWPAGKVPIVTWGNGTCAQPEGYGGLLRYIASHGFFVVAPNNRFVGDGSMQRKGIDFAVAANADSKSPYFGKLDTDKVIAMGHSQGGLGTTVASSDPRIKAAILFNGGTSAPKPFMAISGDNDLGTAAGQSAAESYGRTVTGSSQSPVAWLWYHMIPGSGHVTLMTQPERLSAAAVAWSKFVLLGDAESKKYFAGPSCELCGKETQFRFGQKGIQ